MRQLVSAQIIYDLIFPFIHSGFVSNGSAVVSTNPDSHAQLQFANGNKAGLCQCKHQPLLAGAGSRLPTSTLCGSPGLWDMRLRLDRAPFGTVIIGNMGMHLPLHLCDHVIIMKSVGCDLCARFLSLAPLFDLLLVRFNCLAQKVWFVAARFQEI